MSSKSDKYVGIDSVLLCHAYRDKNLNDQCKLNQKRARGTIRAVKDAKLKPCISIISVAEFLVRVPAEMKTQMLTMLSEEFMIVPFNKHAAVIASGLVDDAKRLVDNTRPNDRAVLFGDTKILASLLAFGCNRFETMDEKFTTLARKICGDVNTFSPQPELTGFAEAFAEE